MHVRRFIGQNRLANRKYDRKYPFHMFSVLDLNCVQRCIQVMTKFRLSFRGLVQPPNEKYRLVVVLIIPLPPYPPPRALFGQNPSSKRHDFQKHHVRTYFHVSPTPKTFAFLDVERVERVRKWSGFLLWVGFLLRYSLYVESYSTPSKFR